MRGVGDRNGADPALPLANVVEDRHLILRLHDPAEAAEVRQRRSREAADKALAVTRQELALRVRSAFYLLLASEKQVVAVRETVTAREGVFRQAQEFFAQGIRAKVDVARAEANLYAARTSLIREENNREIARVEVANAMGLATMEDRSPVEPPPVAATLPERSQAQQDAVMEAGEAMAVPVVSTFAVAGGFYDVAEGFTGNPSFYFADQVIMCVQPPNPDDAYGTRWAVTA